MFAYQYSQEEKMATGCITFTVKNIPILHDGDGNLIGFYLTEQDGAMVKHLYTASLLLDVGSKNRIFSLDFGPSPAGSFIAK
jgi:hypothetical protein